MGPSLFAPNVKMCKGWVGWGWGGGAYKWNYIEQELTKKVLFMQAELVKTPPPVPHINTRVVLKTQKVIDEMTGKRGRGIN